MLSLPLTGLSSDDAAMESTQAFGWGCAAVWGSRVWERELPPSDKELKALQERTAQTTPMFPRCLFVAWVVLFFLVPLSPAAQKDLLVPKSFFLCILAV